jgi:hypothetical protein
VALLTKAGKSAAGVDYQHIPLTDQLNLGLRNLELDVLFDPEGGRYAHPLGHKLLSEKAAAGEGEGTKPVPINDPDGDLKTAGFKVLHSPDFDFRSTVYGFERALALLAAWSDAHPGHVPVIVTMNAKQAKGSWPGSVDVAPFDAAVFDRLDGVLRAGLGARLLTPDDIRDWGGVEHATLPGALAAHGWPAIKDIRGRFLFVLDETGNVLTTYTRGHAALKGRCMFTLSEPGSPEAAIMILNEPKGQQAKIKEMVKAGYIVRTRADADTREARANDRSRFEAAMASGAQVITTDYYIPDLRIASQYVVRFGVETPFGAYTRANPLTVPAAGSPTTPAIGQ